MSEAGDEHGLQFVDSRDAVPDALARSFSNGCTCLVLHLGAAVTPENQLPGDWWVIAHDASCAYLGAMIALNELDD